MICNTPLLSLETTSLRVADYMSPNPIAVGESYRLQDAIDLMAEHGIGNLIIEKRHKPIGLLTEREILRHLVTHKKIRDVNIGRIEPSKFEAVDLQDSIIEAAKLMIARKARLLVFENGKKFVGIITATDMVRAFRRTRINPSLVGVLSKKIYSVKYDDSILKSCKIMNDKRIGSVIVTKGSKPHGIFTERDLLVNVLRNGSEVHNPVGGYCTTPLITAKVGTKGSDAAKIMSRHGIKRLALTRAGKVAAIVTARDIVDAFQWSFRND